MKKRAIPVFMFHSVGITNDQWQWRELTIPYKEFEKQLIYLRVHNYHSIHLDDLYEYEIGEKELPERTIVFTFDDGYLDNYVFAMPLLKKYGFKGTIFVNPDFVDVRRIVRRQYCSDSEVSNLETTGYLSWDELQILSNDGTLEIQSHATTHTWYPISNEVIDFRHPGDSYIWMTWNSHQKEKSYLQIDSPNLIRYGEPVYRFEKSLCSRRYFPNKELSEHLVEFVSEYGSEKFFKTNNWREILSNEYNMYRATHLLKDRYESNNERTERVKNELSLAKKILEEKISKKVDYLCWPGGSGTSEGQLLASSMGYKMTTAARDLPHSIRVKIKNDGKLYSNRIARCSPILISLKVKGHMETIYCDGFGMFLRCKAFSAKGLFQKTIKLIIVFYGYLILIIRKYTKNDR